MTDCNTFVSWLDQGSPDPERAAAAAHAAGCASCAERWRVDRSLERALRAAPEAAPVGFTDRVMARVGRGPSPLATAAPAMPWWIRAAMEPVTALALVASGALAWSSHGWAALVTAGHTLLHLHAPWLPSSLALTATGTLGLQVAAASLLALSSGALYRAVGRLAARGH